jgi:hypothetical protein
MSFFQKTFKSQILKNTNPTSKKKWKDVVIQLLDLYEER